MATTRRQAGDPGARWLLAMAQAVTRELEGADLDHLSLRHNPKLGRAVSDGWYVTLAVLRPRGGTLSLFLDKSATPDRRVWFGTWFGELSSSRAVEAALRASYGPAIESDLQHALRPNQLGRPIREPGGGRYGHYFGIYARQPANTRRPAPRPLIAEIIRYCELVNAALGGGAAALVATLADVEGASSSAIDDTRPRERIRREILARRGQARFRRTLIASYEGRCCVTGADTRAVLEAAHIEVVQGTDRHDAANGLLLRSDIHTQIGRA